MTSPEQRQAQELQKANEVQKAANELQYEANKLQQEMINEIKTNNNVTSKHNTIIRWLTGAIIFLTLMTVLINYNRTGRYAILQGVGGGFFILDTKTSQVWGRVSGKMAYLGTIEKPVYEIREIDETKRVSEIVSELEEAEKSLDSSLNELIPDELINRIEERQQ